jgi:hypothetical protein
MSPVRSRSLASIFQLLTNPLVQTELPKDPVLVAFGQRCHSVRLRKKGADDTFRPPARNSLELAPCGHRNEAFSRRSQNGPDDAIRKAPGRSGRMRDFDEAEARRRGGEHKRHGCPPTTPLAKSSEKEFWTS